jgi:predicted nucleic acid-binding protein
MKLLLDTNVLLRVAHPGSIDHVTAQEAILKLVSSRIEVCVVPQTIYEFWVVATRPVAVNGLGMDVASAERSILGIQREFELLKDERGVFAHWQELVITGSVLGKTAHDARLVAAMKRHGMRHLLTFNVADFKRYSEIQVISPAEILNGQMPAV